MDDLPTDPAYYMRLAEREGDAAIGAGVLTERDALFNCQMLAAVGIDATTDTGPLADLFAAIHRICASQLSSDAPAPAIAPDHWLTGGRFFDDIEAISLAQAVKDLRDRGMPDVSHREVTAILKREGFARQGHAGSGAQRTPRFTRMRATRQQLDAAHPNRHLPFRGAQQ